MYGSTLASRIAGLIFAFLPFMIRSSLKYDPFGDTWASFLAAVRRHRSIMRSCCSPLLLLAGRVVELHARLPVALGDACSP